MEFLVHIEVNIPPGLLTDDQVAAIYEREAERGRVLADAGVIQRLWRIPGRRANWGLWETADADELHRVLSSLPIYPYIDVVEVIPTAAHPSDPLTRDRA
jgi:muconolactone D-isomerase